MWNVKKLDEPSVFHFQNRLVGRLHSDFSESLTVPGSLLTQGVKLAKG